MATVTMDLTGDAQSGYREIDITIEGDGAAIKVEGVWIAEQDVKRIERAIAAHQAAVRALKGQSCTECSESCNATWVPDHITDVNAFPDLEF